MIFRPELAELIRNRRKTQTRRIRKPGVLCRYEPGKDYAVQPGRGQKAIDRILVLTVEQQTLGDVTHQEAFAEGFKDVEGFRDYWRALHKIPDGEPTPWDTPVWAITFELHRPQPKVIVRKDTPKFLTARPGLVKADYTSRLDHAAFAEPEVMDTGWTTLDHKAAKRLERERLTDQADFLDLPIGTQLRLLTDHPNPAALSGKPRTVRSVTHLLQQAA